jgi:hypothetical protein
MFLGWKSVIQQIKQNVALLTLQNFFDEYCETGKFQLQEIFVRFASVPLFFRAKRNLKVVRLNRDLIYNYKSRFS